MAGRTKASRTSIAIEMRALASSILAVLAGCSVSDRATSLENDVPYACASNRDCSNGASCLREFGICARARDSGDVTTVLFEVTPRASERVYGGAQYLTTTNIAEADLGSEDDTTREEQRGVQDGWLELNLPPRVPVSGSIEADPLAACVSRPIARSTLPATLVFTPRERLLGLGVQSYEMSTTFDDDLEEFVFRGSLPPGQYDVYMRPVAERLAADCKAIPQIFRNQAIAGCSKQDGCGQEPFVLEQRAPRSLRLTIPWRPGLDGWVVDMVHPVTGEIISNRVRLATADVDGGNIVANLNYSPKPDNDFILEGDELVRLTPREDEVAGTVLLQRSGLELLTPGEGAVGNVSTFGTPVDYQAWVWKEGEREWPVPGVVSFAALDLDEVAEGVLVSFSASAEVDERGQVNLRLLPGRYRIRVTPPALDDPAIGLLAGFEWSGTVWPPSSDAPTTQAGHVIPVPPAVSLEGTIVAEQGYAPLRGVEVRASASNGQRNPCAISPGAAEAPADEATPCERPRARVIQEALALDPYVPRTRSALSDGNGKFTIDGLDCGPCKPDAGATFDLSVRPALQTGLAWRVRPNIQLDSSVLMESLEIPTPVALPVQLTYASPDTDDTDDEGAPTDARELPGALVRVFALIDNYSQVINDAEGLVPCVTIADPDGSRCIQSLLQLAEVRSDSDGRFLLLLPPRIE